MGDNSNQRSQFLDPKQGNVVVLDFRFTNNGNESKTLHQSALKLLGRDGREFDPDTDTFGYIPNERNIFLEQVNPGVTEDGEATFQLSGRTARILLRHSTGRSGLAHIRGAT